MEIESARREMTHLHEGSKRILLTNGVSCVTCRIYLVKNYLNFIGITIFQGKWLEHLPLQFAQHLSDGMHKTRANWHRENGVEMIPSDDEEVSLNGVSFSEMYQT